MSGTSVSGIAPVILRQFRLLAVWQPREPNRGWRGQLGPVGRLFQIGKDRALRAFIARTAGDQALQGVGHLLHCSDAVVEVSDLPFGNPLNVGALARAVAPQAEQLVDLTDRETKVTSTPNEAEHVNISRRIVAVTRVSALRFRNKTGRFVITDHLR